jgi:nanoRNase/pAp phosphatase (c-di-AMP/oligoRNAs hydrolase)
MDPQQPSAFQPTSPYSAMPPPGAGPNPLIQPPQAPIIQPYTGPVAPYTQNEPFAQTASAPTDIPPAASSQVLSVATQVAQQISGANNLLVTVSNNPSVDQLSAAVGMTLILNKLGKHATAVFSGTIPPVIEFLQPEKTLEKNTDSLRDFIIALDKAKADKLRYKIEDKYVKIFITPYRTSISQKDLQFSQGELNVDVVLALGVRTQNELDQAITAHGQILHDATIISINHQVGANLGSINWNETRTSSLCELVAKLAEILQQGQQKRMLDKQVATALLTGAVAETDRFSNSKTTPETMTMAARLMDAGANQPLIANKLEKIRPIASFLPKKPGSNLTSLPTAPPGVSSINTPRPVKPPAPPDSMIDTDGSLHIAHDTGDDDDYDDLDIDKIHIDEQGQLQRLAEAPSQPAKPPTLPTLSPPVAPAPSPNVASPIATAPPTPAPEPASSSELAGIADETLSDLEKAVNSPHVNAIPPPEVQPPAGPPAATSNSLLGPDPSQAQINNVKPANGPILPGSANVNSSDANGGGILLKPAGQSSSASPSGGMPLPPPVPPPLTPGSMADNLSDPNSGVPL